MAKATSPIRVKHGKGVMSKDGTTPFAAGTIHATNRLGFMSPYIYSPTTVAVLLADDSIMEIQVIDMDNVQSTITKTWIKRDEEARDALRARIAEAVG